MFSNFLKENKTITLVKNHKVLGSLLALLAFLFLWMAFTGTLSYPYIMASRQVQSIANCTFGSSSFKTDKYGFSFSVPEKYCILPNRLFPLDGSIEILPKGWYFVFGEYAYGTVARASKATVLFEPITSERDPDLIVNTLVRGKFLNASDVSSTTTASGIKFILANSASGIDGDLYDWAFTTHPSKKYFVAIVTRHISNEVVRNYLLESFVFR